MSDWEDLLFAESALSSSTSRNIDIFCYPMVPRHHKRRK